MAEAGEDVVRRDLDEKGNGRTAERVRQLGRKVLALSWEVTREAEVVTLFETADEEFGQMDIALTNQSTADPAPQPVHDYLVENWHTVACDNLTGVSANAISATLLACDDAAFMTSQTLAVDRGIVRH